MIDFDDLAEPFAASELEWRVGSKTKKGDKATLLVYITARAVMARLDAVCGPAGWRDAYTPLFDQGRIAGYLCELSLEVEPGRWASKVDGADVTDIEAIKGGISAALKRAASKWLIGRYLYEIDSRWHVIKEGYGPDDKSVYCPMGPGKDGPPGHVLIPTVEARFLPKPKTAKKPKKGDPIDTTPTPEDQALADQIAAEKAKAAADGFPTREPPPGTTTVEPLDKAAEKAKRAADDAARRKLWHESWEKDRAGWCARIQQAGLNPDIAMDLIARTTKGVRPSAMDAVRRGKATEWLLSGAGMLAYDGMVAEREMDSTNA